MGIEQQIREAVARAISELYGTEFDANNVPLELTRKDQNGDFTVVVFPLLRISRKKPEETAKDIGEFLKSELSSISSFEVIKGFLNLSLSHSYWLNILELVVADENFGFTRADDESPLMMIEYSSPNTNKPLHLGHIRNNLLGYSLSRIGAATGRKVVKTNIVNDRGIHICKSMLAWQKWGEGQTPETTGKKGDHLVGDFYVKFDQELKKELSALQEKGLSKEEAEKESKLMEEARNMLRAWEAGDEEVVTLWKTMNDWVYAGFDETYKALGVDFDKIYYESQTYTVGRDMVLKGLEKGLFYRRDDNSVWADLSENGLDEKILLRSDGTSVYMTQDIGTAKMRFEDYKIDKMVYVVGNEQDYHFKVLSILLDRLGFEWGKDLVHFSYGMVELPEGKMKSREGTVVDADDLVAGMIDTAREMSKELGKLDGYTDEEAERIYRTIALAALKYFILKVDPRKNMTFDPRESIDFNGNTGPFIQYTYARVQSVFRKAGEKGIDTALKVDADIALTEKEAGLIKLIGNFPNVVKDAGESYSPAIVANYVYDLAKEFNQFYHESPIVFEEDAAKRSLRLTLSHAVGQTIKQGMWLMGIDVPERM
ncbi:arginine--tRNA ligase [Marinilabilia salmonicolor]|jgi:arginyl-tRNA synthetase|uniref:Arginine--tRNA ligase n=1 Tax=Marinilabilia salmonicolor TaxID=989 RepID=A0A2T0XAE2_9BACT|nr:arginine--tRNA ligase [Marinilabilia salmonicolor]PRY95906.1 arginyl-tRNA synthetase [Marinilabilia salmonicolor]RCW26114.1 arginyl-tRNA synthetase [Marinilabilia salmonicolor]